MSWPRVMSRRAHSLPGVRSQVHALTSLVVGDSAGPHGAYAPTRDRIRIVKVRRDRAHALGVQRDEVRALGVRRDGPLLKGPGEPINTPLTIQVN
jgi:hypothetical protein